MGCLIVRFDNVLLFFELPSFFARVCSIDAGAWA